MISLSCRPLSLADLPGVIYLDQACFGGLWGKDAYRREIDSPNSDLLVLELQDPLDSCRPIVGIGCLWSILDEAHITVLGIEPAHQRQGLGQWLLLHLLQTACWRGLTHATLEVKASNTAAQQLYGKLGFQVAGKRPKYYADGEDALILWKSALQTPATNISLQAHFQTALGRLNQYGWQGEQPHYPLGQGQRKRLKSRGP